MHNLIFISATMINISSIGGPCTICLSMENRSLASTLLADGSLKGPIILTWGRNKILQLGAGLVWNP